MDFTDILSITFAAISVVVSVIAVRFGVRESRRAARFQEAQWTLAPAWDETGGYRATWALHNVGSSVATDVRVACSWDPAGIIVPPHTWQVVPPDATVTFRTKVSSSAWLGAVGTHQDRRTIEVAWRSLGGERLSYTLELPEGHGPQGPRPAIYTQVLRGETEPQWLEP